MRARERLRCLDGDVSRNLTFRQERGQPDGAAAERGQDAEARGAARPRLDPRTRRGGCTLQTKGMVFATYQTTCDTVDFAWHVSITKDDLLSSTFVLFAGEDAGPGRLRLDEAVHPGHLGRLPRVRERQARGLVKGNGVYSLFSRTITCDNIIKLSNL